MGDWRIWGCCSWCWRWFCCVACVCPAAGVDGNLGIGRAGGFRRGRGSMARTSLWSPAHWVRDRLVDSLLASWAVFWGCWLREKNWDWGEGSCLSAISCDSRLQDQVQEHKRLHKLFYDSTALQGNPSQARSCPFLFNCAQGVFVVPSICP